MWQLAVSHYFDKATPTKAVNLHELSQNSLD